MDVHVCYSSMPSLLQFSSYIFYFQALLAGPLCFYSDYLKFVDGSHFTEQNTNEKSSDPDMLVPTVTTQIWCYYWGRIYLMADVVDKTDYKIITEMRIFCEFAEFH